ncbi:MAG: hypothetical protein E7600_02665 [Ruminococcaceae bacterium]|nr:hypothetical protein [Oscillospiraceae bacterium]
MKLSTFKASRILFLILICITVISLAMLLGGKTQATSVANTQPTVIAINGDNLICTVNGNDVPLLSKCYTYKEHVFFPIVDVFPTLGYSVGWDSDLSAVTLLKDGVVSYLFPFRNNIWVGPTEYIFDHKPLTVNGRAYMSEEMFYKFFPDGSLTVNAQPCEYKDGKSILYSERCDDYRLAGTNVYYGGNVFVIDGFGMELPLINEANAKAYAKTITDVANSLDESINVYNIVVPTAAEFYAPLNYYPNHLYGIQRVYENLGDRVTSVNIFDTLAEHADEKLYFKTDHHWTQRGAYYAYREFMSYKGITVPELDTFKNVPSYNFVGSFASFAKGTTAGNIMSSSPELLERFIPRYADSGVVYTTPALTRWTGSYKAVNTNNNSYTCFIGGDNPIIIYDTTADSDKTLVIIKESYGNPFATWAMNDFKRVCVIDPRRFNGFNGNYTQLNLNSFCKTVGATDVVFINYPIAVVSAPIRNSISKMK